MPTHEGEAAVHVPIALDVEAAVGAEGEVLKVLRGVHRREAEGSAGEEVQHVVVPVGPQIERWLDQLDEASLLPGRVWRGIDVVVVDLIELQYRKQPERSDRD